MEIPAESSEIYAQSTSRVPKRSNQTSITATEQSVAADRLQLRSFLTALPAAAELGRSAAALGLMEAGYNQRVSRTKKIIAVVSISAALFLLVSWTRWHNGEELARSKNQYYTVVVHKVPRRNGVDGYLSVLNRLTDSQADGFYRYQIAIYSDFTGSTPITSRSFPYEEISTWQDNINHFKWTNAKSVEIIVSEGYSYQCRFDDDRPYKAHWN